MTINTATEFLLRLLEEANGTRFLQLPFVLLLKYLLQKVFVSYGHSDVLQQLHGSIHSQISCFVMKRAVTGSDVVLIDASNWILFACPIKGSTMAAFPLQQRKCFPYNTYTEHTVVGV